MPSQKSLEKQRQLSPSQSASMSPYQLGGLYNTHWPTWDVNSKQADIVSRLKFITEVQYQTGDYAKAHFAFPLYISELAGASTTTTTHIYIPICYKPILRLLNAKMAWYILCLTFGTPQKAKNTTHLAHKVAM